MIVLDVVTPFPGRRVVAGDVFVLDPFDPQLPISEIRYHGGELLPWLQEHLPLMRCRVRACHSCPLVAACPHQTSQPGQASRSLRLLP